MDWMNTNSLKRKSRKKRAHFEKSRSEPNLTDARFPENLPHLIHQYVTVDELKFYRRRRPSNIDDEFHSKDSICLYDQSQPIIPFAAIKSEYTKRYGKIYSPRSRSVPNRIDLNATTKELLDALQDDFTPQNQSKKTKTAQISGEIEIDGVGNILGETGDNIDPESADNANASQEETNRKCKLKVQGELTYSPDGKQGNFKGDTTMERSGSTPYYNNITFYGKFHGRPEYRDSYKTYNHFAKSAPIKARNHLHVKPITSNTAIITPNISPLSEYTDKFQELNLNHIDRKKIHLPTSNVSMRNDLMIGHSDQHVFPEYFDSYSDPLVRKVPDRAKPRSPILSLAGEQDYNPEYRVKFTEFPRRRPVTQKPESHFDFFDRTRRSPSIEPAIAVPKFNPNSANVAVVEPSFNIHQPLTIDKNPFYVCQPEVRKARREILIKKRPPSPNHTLAATVRRNGHLVATNEDEENKSYNERSHIVTSPVKPPIQVTDFDEPSAKPTMLYGSNSPLPIATPYTKRNRSKVIEGNADYGSKKKTSLTSSTTDDDFGHGSKRTVNNGQNKQLESSSFVILKDPLKQNKWMKSSWYL